jgi:hypothetical protein
MACVDKFTHFFVFDVVNSIVNSNFSVILFTMPTKILRVSEFCVQETNFRIKQVCLLIFVGFTSR